jgi:hypothetical protein
MPISYFRFKPVSQPVWFVHGCGRKFIKENGLDRQSLKGFVYTGTLLAGNKAKGVLMKRSLILTCSSFSGGYKGRVLGVPTPLWMLNKLKILLKIEFCCVNKTTPDL